MCIFSVVHMWRNRGFPTLGYMLLTRDLRQRCLASLLDTLDSLTSDLTAVIFHIPPHKYSYSPLLAGFLTNFRPIRVKRWRMPYACAGNPTTSAHLSKFVSSSVALGLYTLATSFVQSWAAWRVPPLRWS